MSWVDVAVVTVVAAAAAEIILFMSLLTAHFQIKALFRNLATRIVEND